MNQVTTTKRGFRIEDITFKHARKQSEIEKEIKKEDGVEVRSHKAPVSLTPEQVKSFYVSKMNNTKDLQEKKVYKQTISWIDELLETKKEVISLKSKEAIQNKLKEE